MTGAALVADAATGGMGGGMAVRAASVAARAGKAGQMAVKAATAVDRANTAYETGSALVENGAALAEARSEGDTRGMVKAAAGMALEMAVGKKADGALGAISDSQRQTRQKAENVVESIAESNSPNVKSGVYEIRGEIDGELVGYTGSGLDMFKRSNDKRHAKLQNIRENATNVTESYRPVDVSDAATLSQKQSILRYNEQLSLDEAAQQGVNLTNDIRARAMKKMEQGRKEIGDRRQ